MCDVEHIGIIFIFNEIQAAWIVKAFEKFLRIINK